MNDDEYSASVEAHADVLLKALVIVAAQYIRMNAEQWGKVQPVVKILQDALDQGCPVPTPPNGEAN